MHDQDFTKVQERNSVTIKSSLRSTDLRMLFCHMTHLRTFDERAKVNHFWLVTLARLRFELICCYQLECRIKIQLNDILTGTMSQFNPIKMWLVGSS